MTYNEFIKKSKGNSDSNLMLFTLSTCIWCRKTKNLLAELGIGYNYVDVDFLSAEDQEEVIAVIENHNPSASFPTIIVNDGERVILGFDEDEIRRLTP